MLIINITNNICVTIQGIMYNAKIIETGKKETLQGRNRCTSREKNLSPRVYRRQNRGAARVRNFSHHPNLTAALTASCYVYGKRMPRRSCGSVSER